MAEKEQQWRQETVNLDGSELTVIKGGSGRPLLVLHEEMGHPGWLKWHAEMARDHSLIIPLHPGFGASPRVEWIWNIRDLAGFYARFLRHQKLAPIDVIGFSLGGWMAAEMAANNQGQFKHMILVGAAGVRPSEGEILDLFQLMAPAQLAAGVLDPDKTPEFDNLYGGIRPEAFELWEEARAETARLAWVPYMHNPSLPHLLRVIDALPTLLLWGRQDAVVPLSAGEAYKRAISGAQLTVLDQCGHRPEIEQNAAFIREVKGFLS